MTDQNSPGDGDRTAVSTSEQFGELEADLEELRTAPSGEVADGLDESLGAVREAAENVQDALANGSKNLTDETVEQLWNASATLTAWSRDVLVHRTESAERREVDGAEESRDEESHA